MATPDQVRSALQVVTTAAAEDLRAVAGQAEQDAAAVRASLFAATPLIVSEYANGTAALALDWYEELREVAQVFSVFRPQPLVLVTDEDVSAAVAVSTDSLYEIERGVERDLEEALQESLTLIEAETQRLVADAFRDTVTENVKADPDAAGWKRHARPEACKLCKMLAARGAVYTRETARFAAHSATTAGKRTGGNCLCIAGPEFGGPDEWAEATPMQYVASKRQRTEKERAALRDYLNENFPDAPG